MVEHLDVRADRDVVPRHEPQAREIQWHVVVPQPALVPGGIVRRAPDHRAACRHGHRVGVNAARALRLFHDVLRRQVPERLAPVDRRHLRREIEEARRRDEILAAGLAWEQRPHLILLAVDPRDEQHLHRAAAIPVALLVVRADASDAGAEALHVHRGKSRMAERGDGRLPLGGRRASGRAHFAVRPRLLRQPLHRVVAVGDRRAEDVVVPLREEVPALVLDDVGVAPLHDGERRGHVGGHAVADVPVIEVVGRLREHNRDRAGGVLRAVDVGGQPDPVAHRHHDLALDDGDGLELVLEVDAPLRIGRRESTLLRGHQGGERHDEKGEGEGE